MLQVSVQSEVGERKGQLDPEGSVSDPLLRRQESLCGIHPPGEASEHFISKNLSKSSPVQALYASKIVSYAQGFMLLRQAAKEFGWNLNYGGIALMWRGGCIIRSR